MASSLVPPLKPVLRFSQLQTQAARPFATYHSSRQTAGRWVLVAAAAAAAGVAVVAVHSSRSVLVAEAETNRSSSTSSTNSRDKGKSALPIEQAVLTAAPNVPPPITRRHAVQLVVDMVTTAEVKPLDKTSKYETWTFNGSVPGPLIRARVGDVLEVRYTNLDRNGIGHNIDFHCVTGPGGGAPALFAEEQQTRIGTFKLLHPGLFVYHCAAEPVAAHISNGMYGLVLVEPEDGLPPVDKEFYVMQSEFYTEKALSGEPGLLEYSYVNGLNESPSHVVFNGRAGALTDSPLRATQGERVRIFFGNAGPNLVSSFHVIGTIFDKVYREGDLVSPPARSVQTTIVPSGGAAVVEIATVVPGNFTLVDHSIYRIEKGCVGFLKVAGADPHTDIYASRKPLINCPGCKLHA